MVDSNVHEVVKLLVARMESHPEEFKRSLDSRWYDAISSITEFGNETDKAAMNAKLRDIRLQEAHEEVLDELLNGEERRKAEEEKANAMQQSLYASRVQPAQQAQQYLNQSAVAAAQFQNIASLLQNPIPGTPPNGVKVPAEKVFSNPGIISTIKKALGL